MERGADQSDHQAATAPEAVGLSDAQRDHLWNLRHAALYRCQLSTRYHRRRERFFDWMDRAANAAALIGGSAAFAAAGQPEIMVAPPWYKRVLAQVVDFEVNTSYPHGTQAG